MLRNKRFLQNRGHDYILPAVKTERFKNVWRHQIDCIVMYVKPHICRDYPTMNKDPYYHYYYANKNTWPVLHQKAFLKKSQRQRVGYFSVPFVWITSVRFHVERKRKIYQYFANGTTQSCSCFRRKKITSTIWWKFFTKIFVQMVSAHRKEEDEQTDLLKTMEGKKNWHYNRLKQIYQNYVPYTIQPEKRLL